MATIDIDPTDLDLDDLMEGLLDKLDYSSKMSDLEKSLAKRLQNKLITFTAHLPKPDHADNLADQMKMEFLLEISTKYSEQQLRAAIGFWAM